MRIDANQIMPIVYHAARLFRDRDKVRHTEQKGYGNYVTEADKAVQQEIRTALATLYPDVQFYAEEKDNGDVDIHGDYWILDPIDGTMNLMRDYAHSAISLGYAEDGELALGIIYDPFRDEMFYGAHGCGSYMLQQASDVFGDAADAACTAAPSAPWQRIHVSTAQSLSESIAIVGTAPYNRDQYADRYKEAIYQVFMRSQDVRRFGAAVLDLAWVACGRADVYFEHVYLWDRAAGTVIVQEAGGQVTTFDGSAPQIKAFGDIVAGAPHVAAEVVGVLRETFG